MGRERVALLHSYLADRKDKEKPDRLTRTGILAAAELYRHDEIEKICITVEPELSGPQVRRLRTLLNNPPEEDIVVEGETVTTEEEVKTFNKLAENRGWNNPITISNHAHTPRIKREIRKTFMGKGVEVKNAREILSQYPRYSHILTEMKDWPEQKSLNFQEKVLSLPILGNMILKTGPHLSRYKVALQTWVFKQIENRRF